jgi:hypothetical protein
MNNEQWAVTNYFKCPNNSPFSMLNSPFKIVVYMVHVNRDNFSKYRPEIFSQTVFE